MKRESAIVSDDDLNDLTDIYIVSNTPSYLYKCLRLNTTVSALARVMPPGKLAAICEKPAKKKKRTLKDVVLAYAALVALTLKSDEASAEQLALVDLSALDWGEQMRQKQRSGAAKFTFAVESPAASLKVTTADARPLILLPENGPQVTQE